MTAHPQHPECDDLDWRSFRYLSGEMSSVEQDEFERELESSIEACAALVRMTRLALAAREVLEDSVAVPVAARVAGQAPERAGGWSRLALGISALSLVVGLVLFGRSGSDLSPQAGSLEQTAALVSQWSDAAEDEPLFERDDETAELTDLELPHIPGWMLAAVSLEQQAAMPNPPGDRPDLEPQLQDN